jgi:hypothetical protein
MTKDYCKEHMGDTPCAYCEIEYLKSQLAVAVEALEFYGDKENYNSEDYSRTTGNKVYDIVLFDFERGLKKDYAGRRAREALAKVRATAKNNKGESK